MAVTKAQILTFASDALGMHDSPYTGTDLDVQIQAALDDLAAMHCLPATDTSQTLTSSSTYLNYPSDCLNTQQAIRSVVLTDSSAVRQAPLDWLPGGMDEYNRLMEAFSTSARSTPAYRVCDGSTIWLYPAPEAAYTVAIDYYKRHPDIALGTVVFPDDWKMAIFMGTVYFAHLLAGDEPGINLWEPRYFEKKERCRISIPRETTIRGG